jgi:A/G-specific adenine glycosylase
MSVSEIIENWYLSNKRDLPWRKSESPYHIWLSEIILQQTRVLQGLDYYLRFVEKYPSVIDLANAPIDEILKLWQGLGYYTRARNLHATAKIIVRDFNGAFPGEYKELIKLRGIGPYTAAAIASIAFKEPVALVDGNVFRVLSRLYGIDKPIDSPEGKRVFEKKATEILNPSRPDIHNQAMMEFGALVCLPRNPDCNHCVLSGSCIAYRDGKISLLPVKKARAKARIRYLNYLFIRSNGFTYLQKRNSSDIWNSLYEFPLIESHQPLDPDQLISLPVWKDFFGNLPMKTVVLSRTYKHQLTHQTLYCSFYEIRTDFQPGAPDTHFLRISLTSLPEFAVPRIIDKYLEDLKQEGLL